MGGLRAGSRALAAALCATALACEEPAPAAPPPPSAAEPATPAPGACELDEPTTLPGEVVALGAGALVLREVGALRLRRLEEPDRAIALDAQVVARRGLVTRARSVLVLAGTSEGASVLVVEGDRVESIPLAAGSLERGALAARGDSATAAWTEEGGTLRVATVDLLRRRAGEPEAFEAIEGAPLVAATRSGAVVTWSARGASLLRVGEASTTRASTPGLPLDLLSGPERVGVLYEAADRTGAWLASEGAPAVRVTHPEARPSTPAIAPLPSGSVLVYREGADVFLQRLTSDAIPRGGPVVVGSAAPDAPHAPPLLATDGGRAWIAWQTRGETGPEARVRLARCP